MCLTGLLTTAVEVGDLADLILLIDYHDLMHAVEYVFSECVSLTSLEINEPTPIFSAFDV